MKRERMTVYNFNQLWKNRFTQKDLKFTEPHQNKTNHFQCVCCDSKAGDGYMIGWANKWKMGKWNTYWQKSEPFKIGNKILSALAIKLKSSLPSDRITNERKSPKKN